jgi:hypothetical protein
MSGGSLDYFCYTLEDHSNDFDDKELNDLVSDLAQLFHDREWYLSGDTGWGSWREARDKFKDKWFTEYGRQERIEKYLAELGNEVREQLGLNRKYCKTCAHWTQRKDSDHYGDCKFKEHVSMHRCEYCDKWEKRDG